jgi:S1-C subfamily serine protease
LNGLLHPRQRWLAAAGALALAAGCAHLPPPRPGPPPAPAVTLQTLPDYLQARVATLFWGADALTLTAPSPGAGTAPAAFKFTPQGAFGYGVAAAIDARGYFLTAAHVVRREPVFVILLEGKAGSLHPRVLRARVVFKGKPAGQGTDLAVLRVGTALPSVFDWAQTYANGDPVVSAGRDTDHPGANGIGTVLRGGRLLGSIPDETASPPRLTFFHTTPIRAGDSGGPLVTTSGRLIGINVAFAQAAGGWPLAPSAGATAHRPDLAWLRQVIAVDWAQNPN